MNGWTEIVLPMSRHQPNYPNSRANQHDCCKDQQGEYDYVPNGIIAVLLLGGRYRDCRV